MKRWIGIGSAMALVCMLATTEAWGAKQGAGTLARDRLRVRDCDSLTSSEGDQIVTGATARSVTPTAVQRRIQQQDRLNYPGEGKLTQAQKRANYLAQKAAVRAAYDARKAAAKAAYQARQQTRTQDPANCPNDCSGDRLRDRDRDRLRDGP